MRRRRRELGSRREQGGQVKHLLDLELGEDPFEQVDVGDRAGELARDERRERRIERADVDGDDRRAGSREAGDEAVTDFAAGAGDEDDRFTQLRRPERRACVPGAARSAAC